MELLRAIIDIPVVIYEKEEAHITVTFFPPHDQGSFPFNNPLDGLTATLIAPSGDRQAISLPRQPTRTSIESLGLKLTFTPGRQGVMYSAQAESFSEGRVVHCSRNQSPIFRRNEMFKAHHSLGVKPNRHI